MAEKIIIAELDISQDDLIEKLQSITHRLKEQKDEIKDLELAQENLRKEGKVGSTQ